MNESNSIISFEAELPEPVYMAIQAYLAEHPGWTMEALTLNAFTTMLIQHTEPGSKIHSTVSRHYLDSLFKRSVGNV